MRIVTSLAVLAALAAGTGCGSSAGAGENWIFYTWEQSSTDSKGAVSKRTVQEAINVKSVSMATFYEKGSDDKPMLWMIVAAREVKISGDQASSIWKGLHKHN